MRDEVARIADRHGLDAKLSQVFDQPATPFVAACVAAVREAAAARGSPTH